jgi:hypothetical protein
MAQPWEPLDDLRQHQRRAITVLDIGGVDHGVDQIALGVCQDVALASRGGNLTLRALRSVRETLASYGSHQANGTLRPSRQCTKRPGLLRAILSRNCPARVLCPEKRLNFRITHARSV